MDEAVRSGVLHCQPTVDLYDAIIADAPVFDVSGCDEVTQYAYNAYRQAIDVVSDGARDMAGNCRDWLADPREDGVVPFQQWGLARQRTNEAAELVNQAIRWLEQR